MTFSLLGRLHMPALGMVLAFLAVDWTGSYAIGGVIGATVTGGQAVAGPLRGRAADRSSAPKLLLLTGFGSGLGMTAMVGLTGWLDPAHWWLILPLAVLTGLSHPPVTQLGRAIWPRLTSGPAREAAFSVEATLQELLFVVAPMLAAFAVAFWGPVAAMLCCASWAVLGPALFAAALWRAGLREAPPPEAGGARESGSLFRMPGFASLLAFFGLLVGGLISVDLVLVGWARERGTPELAGLLAMVWAVGSLVGGLVAGGFNGRPRLLRRAALSALGLLALVPVLPPIADPGSPWLVGAILLVGGSAVAPTLAASNGRLADLAPADRRSEAFGWMASATTLGAALAAPLAGWMLDLSGPAAAATAAAVLAAMSVGFVAHHMVQASRTPREKTQSAVT
ncbi:MFS transporter [Saccharopolyspora sp. K220]|uniref:MFS transporter n=1 Tax=Saccharopolyspora soli TaxID=2926618 RepID=UPI001F5614EE|nr:MFS transporter [Saccharopolyspora soli]MCI2419384.1 MFS transporter [Saccharopolyspora soli]